CDPSLLAVRRCPPPTLFPYTTLFRSRLSTASVGGRALRSLGDLETRTVDPVDALVEATIEVVDLRVRGVTVVGPHELAGRLLQSDRKSTRLNSSHVSISYAVFCLQEK